MTLPLAQIQAKQAVPIPPTQISLNQVKCGSRIKKIQFKPPASKPALPGSREQVSYRCGPGYRTPDGKIAIALLPKSAFSLTTSPHPTILVYTPYTSLKTAIFRIANRSDRQILYQTEVTLPGNRGILSFSLPRSISLETDKTYVWSVTFPVKQPRDPVSPHLWGYLERIQLRATLDQKLRTAPAKAVPAIYAENSIWLDALTSLASLRCNAADDLTLQADWASLLRQVDLANLAREPLLGCGKDGVKE
ncbi:MAG: DUF928 domain-containing protein [Scytolyngbya sp. HA4215-MV1]|nr:DUF928 domain-containing protein [Scytolyngbya sp. HA4215-MV1]